MYKQSVGERVWHAVILAILLLLSLSCIVPFIVVFSTSLSDASRLSMRGASYVLLPKGFSFRVYNELLDSRSRIWRAYGITLFRVVVGSSATVIVSLLLAYGLKNKDMPGRNLCITLMFFTMFFGGGLIPTYLVTKSLGLTNSVWVYVVPGAASTWDFLIFKNYFTSSMPESLEEAATIDGANRLTILFKIIIPLSLPIIATIFLFCAVSHWNAWFDAAIYITDSKLWPVQIILRNILMSTAVQDLNPEMLAQYDNQQLPPSSVYQCAVIIISTLPILVIYPFVQKYFVKGTLIGSVKE